MKSGGRFLLRGFFLIGWSGALWAAVASGHCAAIDELIGKFKRRITVLEIGRTALHHTYRLADEKKAICVALLLEGTAQDIVQTVKNRNYHTITVLAPLSAPYHMFKKLGRCEHFDVVIVQDIAPLISFNYAQLVTVMRALGDYVFIEASLPSLIEELNKRHIPLVSENQTSSLFLSHKSKKGLDTARFTQSYRPVRACPRYQIRSSFTKKTFFKVGLKRPLNWIEGINLVTFCMLKGVYPTDEQIRKQIIGMKRAHLEHNDFVLGNLIVRGDRVVPIDGADVRRNADFSSCLTAALQAFKESKMRLAYPEQWMDKYYAAVRARML